MGTEARVEKRSRHHVVLRIGSGEEASYLRLRVDEGAFQYSFAFASTIHGAKGRGVGSVHMLASPGLTRRLLHTGASLCQSTLNIVVPVSQEQMIPALTVITRRDDTARAALEYGFDASAHARAVIRAQRGPDRPAPGALMDGLDRTLGWLADSLDGGEKGVRESPPATRRLDSLRRGVMVELMGACRGETGQAFSPPQRAALETRIDQLVFGRGWRRFVGQGWAMRAFEAESERGYIPGVARADQMIDRVLKRGVEMAEAAGEDEMRDWFARAETGMAQVIAEQKAAYAKLHVNPGRKPAQAPPAPQPAPSEAPPAPADLPYRDYRGMALQLAQAISARIPANDPVHKTNHVTVLDEMLRKAEPKQGDPINDADLFRRIPYMSWTTPETRRLGRVVAQALKGGPLMARRTLLAEREAVFRHLDRPEEPMVPAKEFVPRLKVFTHNEVFALHEPDVPWPDSLPARMDLERAVIAKRLRAYRMEMKKGKEMEKADILNGRNLDEVREDIMKDLMLGDLQPDRLSEMKAAFSADEIAALQDPSAELPDSLPSMTKVVRESVADSFKRAVESRKTDSDGTGQAVPREAMAPKIEMPSEPELTPEEARVRDLALSLSSAVSEHVWRFHPIHEMDVPGRLQEMLEAATDDHERVSVEEADTLARQIAETRLRNTLRREMAMALDMPHLTREDMSLQADSVVYTGSRDAFVMTSQNAEEFEAQVEDRWRDHLSSDPPVPTEYDRVVAEVLTRENTDPDLVEALGQALEFGVPQDAATVREMRATQINRLFAGQLGDDPHVHVKDLFATFSHRELDALMKGQGALPNTLPDLDPQARDRIARTMLVLFSRIKGPQDAPSLHCAKSMFRDQARSLGLDADKGPSRGPDL